MSATAAEDVWHPLSTLSFFVALNRSVPDEYGASFSLQIRLSGGAILATAGYSLNIVVIDSI